MCSYLCEQNDGVAVDQQVVIYGEYANKGFGCIITEALSVTYNGRITVLDLGIWEDRQIPNLRRITDMVHKYDTKIGCQLGHAGRKANAFSAVKRVQHDISELEKRWSVVAPSPIPYDKDHSIPHELTESEIQDITKRFGDAANRAVSAGFDFIEIHAAHGFLIHEFLSPISNVRQDKYGGSFANRTRFLKEVIAHVRTRIPETMPIFVRISVSDYVGSGGWDIAESKLLCKELIQEGKVDLMHLSSGGLSPAQVVPENWDHQLKHAAEFKAELGVPIACVGGVWDAETASNAINRDNCDLVMIGKATMRGAFVPRRIANELKVPMAPDYPLFYRWGTRVPSHCKY